MPPIGFFAGHAGSAPSPFDAINGPRLAGGDGSHPLHSVSPEELLNPSDGAVTGEFALDHPARVGDGITGRVRLTAAKEINARKAYLRLVGLRLDEVRREEDHRNSKGEIMWTERWVETSGRLFVADSFLEPPIPTSFQPGQTFEATFMVPAPQLGPPTAHLGESIIAWALEVRWDISMGSDHWAAMYLPLAQHPDLLRAGVGKQGGVSLMASVPVGDASINVVSPLPAPSGQEVVVTVSWPSAPSGQGARIEIHRRTNAPNGTEGIVASVPVDPASLTSGAAQARLLVPAGSAPSFDGAGLEINYVIRVLVDRRLRSDTAIERPLGIV
ncbi:MAG: hypothetical protein ABSD62_03430 [Candidatus Limnocylindrales bacterium]|jgi:hypothetical protein